MQKEKDLSLNSSEIALKGFCTGCGACTEICPYKKISSGKAVSLFPCDVEKKRCDDFCPKTKTDYRLLWKTLFNKEFKNNPCGNILEIYKSKSGKNLLNYKNKKSITSLLLYIIQNQMTKSVLLNKTDSDYGSQPFLATEKSEIINSSSTHYSTGSPINFIHRNKPYNYAMVGLPCQITSVAKMRSACPEDRPGYLPFLTIGLFCTWALDPGLYSKFLKKELKNQDISETFITSGNKPKIIFKTQTNRKIEKDLSEIKKFIRKGCSMCLDLTNEFSDISIGDFEADEKYNTLIIRTQKGMEIVHNAVNSGYLEIEDYPLAEFKKLEKASMVKKEKALKKFPEQFNF